jgi:REP element-mobilizing transposase RayT
MARFRKSSATKNEFFDGRHRFEHWYRDNTVYFITARCRDKYPAFESDQAKSVFWDRFVHYPQQYGFVPWVTTLMFNHYHVLGYLKTGDNLGPMMQKLHGSVAKLVNDLLPQRRLPFWRTAGNRDYFDGCIRDVLQAQRAYRYTLLQSVRAGLVKDYRHYRHTIVNVEMNRAIKRAADLNAYLEHVPYARYEKHRNRYSQD